MRQKINAGKASKSLFCSVRYLGKFFLIWSKVIYQPTYLHHQQAQGWTSRERQSHRQIPLLQRWRSQVLEAAARKQETREQPAPRLNPRLAAFLEGCRKLRRKEAQIAGRAMLFAWNRGTQIQVVHSFGRNPKVKDQQHNRQRILRKEGEMMKQNLLNASLPY